MERLPRAYVRRDEMLPASVIAKADERVTVRLTMVVTMKMRSVAMGSQYVREVEKPRL